MDKDRKQYLYAILIFVVAEIIQAFVISLCNVLFQGSLSKDSEFSVSVTAVLICGIVFFFWYRNETRTEDRGSIRAIFREKNIIMFLLLGVGFQFFVSGLISLINSYDPGLFEGYYEQIKELTAGNDAWVYLLILVIAPITEELIFRGMILSKACKALPFMGANFLQAVLFGIYHWNIIQGLYAACIGFVLGLVYRKFRTILAPMLLHMIINSTSLPMVLFPRNTVLYAIMILTGAISTSFVLAAWLIPGLGKNKQLRM